VTIRLYLDSKLLLGIILELTNDQSHYLKSVMRVRIHQRIHVFNSFDGEWIAEIEHIAHKSVICKIIEKMVSINSSNVQKMHFFIPLIKADTMSRIFRQITELNVNKITPYIAKYSNIKDINNKRVESILTEATEQSGRICKPFLSNTVEFADIVTHQRGFDDIYFYGDPKSQNTYQDIAYHLQRKTKIEEISIIIGPEGGFDDNEVDAMRQNQKFVSINLGNTILKCDTASVALIQAIMVICNMIGIKI